MSVYAALLGSPRVIGADAVERPLLPDRRGQLLAYLAANGSWVTRDRLAYLFWPDHDDAAARRNLRKLLFKARDLPWASGLEGDRNTARWLVATDVADFERAVHAGDGASAIDAYGGRLLEGFDGSGGEFDSWLSTERARLHESWRATVLVEAERAIARGVAGSDGLDRAVDLLGKLLVADPFDEHVVARTMEIQAGLGRKVDAIGTYRRFSRTLERELGLEPSSDLRALVDRLVRQDGPSGSSRPTASVLTAPPAERGVELPGSGEFAPADEDYRAPPGDADVVGGFAYAGQVDRTKARPTRFVGRRRETSELVRLLSSPSTRLVSIVGAGGTGKSRLATEVAATMEVAFADGVRIAELESVTSREAVIDTVARVMGVDRGGAEDPLDSVVSVLRESRALVVLDGFEHLMAARDVVARLVADCPGVTFLVTSRERLRLESEVVYDLRGLQYPPGAIPSSGPAATVPSQDVAAEETPGPSPSTFDAVALFLDRARLVRSDFEPRGAELRAVGDVCRLLGGSPLGIEMAAVWVRTLRPSELCAELRRTLDILEAPADVPERHRSLRATFEHSWALLGPPERLALERLAVFRGGFDRAAALAVTDTPLVVLAALVDKSLLYVDEDGRFHRHPVVMGFCMEKLAESPAELATMRANHERYFLALVDRIGARILQRDQGEVLRLLETEHENLVAAFAQAVDAGRPGHVERFARLMMLFYDAMGRYAAGEALLETAVGALGAGPSAAACKARAYVLVEIAWLRFRQGDYAGSAAAAEEGLSLARQQRRPGTAAKGLFTLGNIAWRRGDHRAARRYLDEALTLARRLGNSGAVASLLNSLAILEGSYGDVREAMALYRQALGSNRATGNQVGMVSNLDGLASLLLDEGRVDEAVPLIDEALQVAHAAGYQQSVPSLLANRGLALLMTGDLDGATSACREAVEMSSRFGARGVEARASTLMARVASAAGDMTDIRSHLTHAIETAVAIEDVPAALEALAVAAEVCAKRGQHSAAAELAAHVAAHDRSSTATRRLAHEVLGAVGSEPADAYRDTLGPEAPFEDLVGYALVAITTAGGDGDPVARDA